MQLTKNFSLQEMSVSEKAKELHIDNTPNETVKTNLKNLCESILQPLRDKFGSIKVNSGYRSPLVNKAIGGASTSQHVEGNAADIVSISTPMKTVFEHIMKNMDFDQLIWEFGDFNSPSWIHVSYNRNKNRREVLRAIKQGGKTVYIKYIS